MTATLWTLILSLPAAPAPAPKIDLPKGPAPSIMMISTDDEGALIEHVPVAQAVQKQVTVAVPDNQGRVVNVTRTITVMQTQIVKRKLRSDKVEFYGVDGKKIEEKDIRKLVPKPMPVLKSADGKPVERFYLQLARPGTLVLVVPPATPGSGSGYILPADAPKPLPKEREKK